MRMELLKNYNFKDLAHDLILDGSENFYSKVPYECGLPIEVEFPYPIEAPSRNFDNYKFKEFFKYSSCNKKAVYFRREFGRMKNDICNQDFNNYAVLPEFLINYIDNDVVEEVNYGFNISYSSGTLEKFYDNNELCLLRPNINNNIEICKPRQPEKKIILQWLCSDPIRSIKNMNQKHSNSFIVRGQNTLYLIDLDDDFRIKLNLKLRCDVGYLGDTLNNINGSELALMDAKTTLKLFDLKKQAVISSYCMKELYFDSVPRLLKMNYLTENMLMIMTEKQIKVLDNRCKDAPQEIEINLENCDVLLDFNVNKSEQYISDEVYLSSKHAFFIYDIRGASVNDYIHHNLRFPPCFINCFQGKDAKLVTLFGQSTNEAAIFGTKSPYALPYHLHSLEETLDLCRSKKTVPLIPDLEKRLNCPITGIQIVPNDEDISIYFSNFFGEIFRQDVLLKSNRSEEPIERMYEWLMEIYETDDPEFNMVHFGNAKTSFTSETDFNDVDLFNQYERNVVHNFLEHEDFDFTNWTVKDFDKIWDDDNCVEELSLFESKPGESKVEEWIRSNNFGSLNYSE